MIAQALTSSFKAELLQGIHNLATDTFYLALYTSSANIDSTTTAYTTLGETSGAGYTAGGQVLVNAGVSLSGTIAYSNWVSPVTFANSTITASGGLIYNASKGNRSVAVLNFGGAYGTEDADFIVTMPPNTSTTATVIIN